MTAAADFARAVEHHRRGQLAEAEEACHAVVAAEPNHFGARYMLGVIALQRGAFETAIDQIGRALEINPKAGAAHRDRGLALVEFGRFAEAVTHFDAAIASAPGHPMLHYNRGVALSHLGRLNEAGADFDIAIAQKPDFAQAFYNRGLIRHRRGEFAQAIADYDTAIALKPDLADARNNRGNAFKELGRLDEALASYDAAIAIKPDFAECFYNRGVVLLDLKRPDEAVASYDRALRLAPDYAEARFSRGVCQLAMGRMDDAAWSDYEQRWRLKNYSSRASVVAAPRWAGEDLAGRSILIYGEQGLGDVIQFSRFVPELAARGATVSFMVPRKLMHLFAALPKAILVIAEPAPTDRFDFQCPVMSLPQRLRVGLDSLDVRVPYLAFDATRAAAWRERLGAEGFKIGIAWHGAPWHGGANIVGRSVPLSAFAPLARVDWVRLISLQKGDGTEQLAALPAEMRVETLGADFDAGPDAFADTAAIMQSLDLVVTCDTSMAHVAGGLGRPVWIALRHVPEWRWGLDGTDSPWYPTARVFRQKTRGDWVAVFEDIAAAVRELTRR